MALPKSLFDERVAELRADLEDNVHLGILNQLVELYEENNNSFPDTIVIEDFKYRKTFVVQKIMQYLGCSINEYNFQKSFKKSSKQTGNGYQRDISLVITHWSCL